MGGKRTFDFDKAIGKATWVPGFIAFAVFAGVIGISAYSSLSNQISADPAPATEPTTAKVAGSDCGAVIDTDASAKQMASGYIRVAINNYWVPSGLASAAQHKSYNEKTSNSPYRCNEISVKVPNAAKCLTDSGNLNAIKAYVSDQQSLDYVDSAKEFETLTGDKMKKTIVGSSIKAKCLGGSESYEGLTDDRQATDSKAIETAKGKAQGVLSGGEDVKTLTPKANPAVEKQVAQGQESSGSSESAGSDESLSTGASTTDSTLDLTKCRSEVNGFLATKKADESAAIKKIRDLYSNSKSLVLTKKTQLSKCQEALTLIKAYMSVSGGTNATADEPGLSGTANAMLPDLHTGTWKGGWGSFVTKTWTDGQKATTWYSKQGNPYLSIKGKDGKYYRAPLKIDADGNATEIGGWEAYDGKNGSRIESRGGGKVNVPTQKRIAAQKTKSEATAKSVPDAKVATTGKIMTGGMGTWSNGRVVKQIQGQPYSTMIKDSSTRKYYWSMRKNGEYFRAPVSLKADGTYTTVGSYERYTYSRKIHRQVSARNPFNLSR